MVETVVMFGLLTAIFEFVLLCMLNPRTRLRVLGSPTGCAVLHFSFLAFNLIVHWGTVTGSFSAILAFCVSLITVRIAQITFGSVTNRVYTRGLMRYRLEEIK